MDTLAGCAAAGDTPPVARGLVLAATTLTVVGLSLYALMPPRRPSFIRGPLTTKIPHMSPAEVAKITYTPDHFPGARDVETPYGNIRVYEFGPEDGRKVLFIHGISTSCMTLEDIARPLADKGCRVMLFDLFGRGYTDAPADLAYDTRLWTTQVLLVLASSPLAWTGDGGFHLVGYSLGGGIAANFAAAFPRMVATLVLLAPAGVIRPENFGRASRAIFTSGLVPEPLLARLTRWRLRKPIDNAVAARKPGAAASSKPRAAAGAVKDALPGSEKETLIGAAMQEAVGPNDVDEGEDDDPAYAEGRTPEPTAFERRVVDFVHWALDFHEGFVVGFMSTIRHAPLMGQQAQWRALGERRAPGTTAVILGRHDQMIRRDDYAEDALPLLGGRGRVFWRVVPGAHNFPFTHSGHALAAIYEFWGWD